MIELTEHQEEILEKSLEILRDSNRLLIEGSAGVGKTFMVGALLDRLISRGSKKILCTAPTNKAVSVLREKIDESNHISLCTTHSALKLKRSINFKTGEVTFQPSYSEKYPPLKGVDILVIDEASMIPLAMLKEIEHHASKQRCTVIFIGDVKQINPVNEEESPVFIGKPVMMTKMEYAANMPEFGHTINAEGELLRVNIPYPKVELTEIIRQSEDNPVINLSRNLDLIKFKHPELVGNKGYIFTEDLGKVVETLAAVNGSDELKYLAYTNAEIDKINKLVRERIYSNPQKIEVGETLIFNTPYREVYFSNEEIKVNRLLVKEKDFLYPLGKYSKKPFGSIKLKYYSINYSGGVNHISEDSWDTTGESSGTTDNIIVIHEDSEKDLNDIKAKVKNLASVRDIPWIKYYEFLEQFADLKYNHAITVHKSQGSTFEKVIINVKNLNICKSEVERKRLIYTAVTRTSGMVIFYNN